MQGSRSAQAGINAALRARVSSLVDRLVMHLHHFISTCPLVLLLLRPADKAKHSTVISLLLRC